MKKALTKLMFFGLLLVCVAALGAAEERTVIKVYADETRHVKEDLVYLKGSVEIHYQDLVIYGEEAEFDRGKNELFMEGGVVVHQDENVIKSKTMWMDLDEQHIIFREDVETLYHYEQEAEEPIVILIWSDVLELWSMGETVLARGNVRAEYQEYKVTAAEALLDNEEETLTMTGDVYIEMEDGTWLRAEQAIYYMLEEIFAAFKIQSEFILP